MEAPKNRLEAPEAKLEAFEARLEAPEAGLEALDSYTHQYTTTTESQHQKSEPRLCLVQVQHMAQQPRYT